MLILRRFFRSLIMELADFLKSEVTMNGPRVQRWPIAFKISCSQMVAHLYELILDHERNNVPARLLVQAFDLKPITFKFNYTPRFHLADEFPALLTEAQLTELGHPSFQQNFCDRNGTIRQQVWIWETVFRINELDCIKLIKVKNWSLHSEYNVEFHLVVNEL